MTYGSLGLDSLYSMQYPTMNDQYFQNYLSMQNIYQNPADNTSVFNLQNPSFQGVDASSASALAQATSATGSAATSSPSSHVAVPRAEEPKKGGNGGAIALAATSIAAIGAAALISRGRAKAPGTKGLWNQLCEGVKSLGKSSEKVIYDKTKNVVTIPGQQHKILSTSANYKDDLANLGTNAKAPDVTTTKAGKTVLTDGVSVQSGSFVHDGNKIAWEAGGKVTQYTNATEAVDIAYKATIDDIIAKLAKGEYVDGITDLNPTQISHLKDGILRIFKTGENSKLEFAEAVTDKYAIGSDALNQLTSLNENVRKAIVDIGKNEYKITAENIQSATFKVNANCIGHIGPNGQITKFVENGVEYNVGSAGYDTIRNASENSKIFKKLFDDTSKFENVFAIL